MKKTIGIIGLGIMGHGMATNFLRHGYQVHVWNRSPEKAKDLVAAGAVACENPRAVAAMSDIVFDVVSNDEASRSVWFGDAGILAGARPDGVYIASATLSLAYLEELVMVCEERRVAFLDMPLTGSRFGAENGKLRLLTGGDEAVLDGIRPELAAISDKIYYFGPSGSGMRFKLILNMLLAIQIDAAVQAKALARAAGLDPEVVHHAIFDAPMGAASHATDMAFKGVDDPAYVNFSVKWIEKDLRYAREMAGQYMRDINLLNDAQMDYATALAKGFGDRDWTALAELFKPDANIS